MDGDQERHDLWSQASISQLYGIDRVRKDDNGDSRLQALETWLSKQKIFDLTEDQKKWHSLWTQACLPRIYGDEYDAELPGLLKRFGVPSIHTRVIIQGERMHGKLTALTVFLAAYLWTQNNPTVTVIAGSMRQSYMVMAKMHSLLSATGMTQVRISNRELLCFANERENKAYFRVYPPRRLRGIGSSDITVLYEPWIFTDDFLKSVVFPLLQIKKSVMLGITTRHKITTTTWNRFLLQDNPKGSGLIKQYTFACKDCRVPDSFGMCVHILEKMAPCWKDDEVN